MRCGEKTNWSSASDFEDDPAEDVDDLELGRRWDFNSSSSTSLEGFKVAERLHPGGMEVMLANAISLAETGFDTGAIG